MSQEEQIHIILKKIDSSYEFTVEELVCRLLRERGIDDDRPLSLITTQDRLREYLVDNGYIKESGTTPKYTLTDKAKQL